MFVRGTGPSHHSGLPAKEQAQIRQGRAGGPEWGLPVLLPPLTLSSPPPLSKCGTYPPESCLFSLIGNVGAFMGELCPRPDHRPAQSRLPSHLLPTEAQEALASSHLLPFHSLKAPG